jgi:GNAT superfamily N-acetyltransferase
VPATSCTTPAAAELPEITAILAAWQPPGGAVSQLHPGDLGWFRRFGPDHAAGAVRRWTRDGTTLAIGLLDEPDLLRLAFAPDALADHYLAGRVAADLAGLPEIAYVDPPMEAVLREYLGDWVPDQPWVPLHRDLTDPVADTSLAVELVTEETAAERVAVQRASFDGSTFTVERWHAMTDARPYDLLGRDRQGHGVAAVTVWTAGAGRPGIIEPLGVHRDHRGHGYGRDITLAAAAALRAAGASGVTVATPASNTGAVATYQSAGMTAQPETQGLVRPQTQGSNEPREGAE